MDPMIATALIGLVGKVFEKGFDAWSQQASGSRATVAFGVDGTSYAFQGGGLSVPSQFAGGGEPVPFDGLLVPADDWAFENLAAEQLVLLTIDDLDESAPLESLVALTTLEDGFAGALAPGSYRLGVAVFASDDPEEWTKPEGGAIVDFDVEPGEPPFTLTVAIEAMVPIMEGSGSLEEDEEEVYEVEFVAGVEYEVHVVPDDPSADFDLVILDENRNIVAADVDFDNQAIATVTPLWTGTFQVAVSCASGSSDYRVFVSV